jgi:ferric-dicitrate binding protein FerR (iron transport regulator)
MKDLMPPSIRALFEDDPPEERQDMDTVWAAFDDAESARGEAFDAEQTWAAIAEEVDLDRDRDQRRTPAESASGGAREARPPRTRRRSERSSGLLGGVTRALRLLDRRLAVLAVAVVLAAVGTWWWMQPVTLSTAPGEQVTATLPDGSTVELNGGTTLSYPRSFGDLPFAASDERRVRLSGEAFFAVREGRPFVVETPNARVEVLGTEFTVETAGEDAPSTQVALRSGRVRLAGTGGSGQSVTLAEPGAMSRLTGTSAPTPPEPVDLTYAEAWRQGGFAVQQASLTTTLRKLERRFGVSIRLEADSVTGRPMTLLYARDATVEQVLNDVCLVQNLTYRSSSQGYVLTQP